MYIGLKKKRPWHFSSVAGVWICDFFPQVIENYDIYTNSERWNFNVSFYMICVNLNVSTLKVKMKVVGGTHFHHFMHFYSRKIKTAKQCNIQNRMYRLWRRCHNWDYCIKRGNFDLEYRKHTGRPAVIDVDQIETLIKNNTDHATRDIAEIRHISYISVVRHLRTFWGAIRF